MSEPLPEQLLIPACLIENAQPDGTCTTVIWMPYPQQVLPPLGLADGTLVAFAICSLWALGVKAKLMFRAARAPGYS